MKLKTTKRATKEKNKNFFANPIVKHCATKLNTAMSQEHKHSQNEHHPFRGAPI